MPYVYGAATSAPETQITSGTLGILKGQRAAIRSDFVDAATQRKRKRHVRITITRLGAIGAIPVQQTVTGSNGTACDVEIKNAKSPRADMNGALGSAIRPPREVLDSAGDAPKWSGKSGRRVNIYRFGAADRREPVRGCGQSGQSIELWLAAELRQSSGRNRKQRGPAAHCHPVRSYAGVGGDSRLVRPGEAGGR